MCGIFGAFGNHNLTKSNIKKIALHSEQRGIDSSGLCFIDKDEFKVVKADFRLKKLLKKQKIKSCHLIAGHSRLVTNGMYDNQPVVSQNVVVLHNGIIVNNESLWKTLKRNRSLEIDTEIINGLVENFIETDNNLDKLSNNHKKMQRNCSCSHFFT